MNRYILSLLSLIILISACKKDIIETNQNANLHFSNDTIIFDTAFHSIGSPTQTLTIYNHNNFNIITDISLNLLASGSFRMNVDGIDGHEHKSIKIPAKDSIFIFLEVTPNFNENSEFLITSMIEFKTGINSQNVKLVLPGRNAIFHLPQNNNFTDIYDNIINFRYHSIKGDVVWSNDLPHVIYGQVIIEPNSILTIEKGTEIYFHNNSGILVGNPILITSEGTPPLNNGTLIVNGEKDEEVKFQGDRSSELYTSTPGQWNGIYFAPGSINSRIEYAIIKNGTTGIRADSADITTPALIINNTIIKNMSSIGILGQGANISATNTIVSNCGQHTIACNIGGNYNFTHCTFANYWQYNRTTPSVLLNNYYNGIDGQTYPRPINEATFTNCIIYGPLTTEISLDNLESVEFNYIFDHCLIKLDEKINTNNIHYNNVIINQSPQFIDYNQNNLHLSNNSPAINAGKLLVTALTDIEGKIRNSPDLGAYELE